MPLGAEFALVAATTTPTASAQARLGTVVAGTYRITRYIGSGSSSHVFEAEQLRLGLPVALKLLRPELGAPPRRRFQRESRAIASLASEHIVRVIDCGETDDGTPFLVMELLRGSDLRSLLMQQGGLSAQRVCRILLDACSALVEVHDSGLVHRDLKPENLFVTRRSNGEDLCKVLDFGVVKMHGSLATLQGAILGTVLYMAPEQLSDGESVSAAADIYAIGVILYECLAGRSPHEGATTQEVMYKIMNCDPPPLIARYPTLLPVLGTLVKRCLSKDPTLRPASARELARELSLALSELEGSAQLQTLRDGDASAARPGRAAHRTRLWLSATAWGVAWTCGAVGGWFAHSGPRPVSSAVVRDGRAANALPSARVDSPTQASREASSPAGDPVKRDHGNLAQVPSQPGVAVSRQPAAKSAQPRRGTTAGSSPAAASSSAAGVALSGFDPANPYSE